LMTRAGKSISDQLCKTLLLSSGSRIDALPILEINNENVRCTHGSTVSDLDKNHLFYS
jgi:Fe-S cluster assembly protein SufD